VQRHLTTDRQSDVCFFPSCSLFSPPSPCGTRGVITRKSSPFRKISPQAVKLSCTATHVSAAVVGRLAGRALCEHMISPSRSSLRGGDKSLCPSSPQKPRKGHFDWACVCVWGGEREGGKWECGFLLGREDCRPRQSRHSVLRKIQPCLPVT
jgi:hypothetical protein